jgi:hypothetical protein
MADMSTLSPNSQALVRAGRLAYQPTSADRERLLLQLRSELGAAALPANMSAAASAVTASSATWPLISAVVVSVSILGGALFYTWPRSAGEDRVQEPTIAHVAATPQVIEPAAVPPDEQPTAPVAAAAAERPALPTSSAFHSKDRLAAEVAMLSAATRDLRAGRPAQALKTLDDYRRRFPKGMLTDEHRAASAQALCALGRFDDANTKLGKLPPQSPLVVRAKEFCATRLMAR